MSYSNSIISTTGFSYSFFIFFLPLAISPFYLSYHFFNDFKTLLSKLSKRLQRYLLFLWPSGNPIIVWLHMHICWVLSSEFFNSCLTNWILKNLFPSSIKHFIPC